jgi:hypothetical protein
MPEKLLSPANDDGPLLTATSSTATHDAERTARVAAYIDDPCDEGGYDAFCRDRHGQLCRFHEQFCHAPDYPCIDLLRHALAVSFLEEIAQRKGGSKQGL